MAKRLPANETHADIDYDQQHEIITSKARISTLLRPVMDRHTIITATFPDSNKFFNTIFLAIEPDNGLLIIDELNPGSGHKLFMKSKKLTLHTMLDGIDVSFSVKLKNSGTEKGIVYYELEFPESIRYLQRRSSFRVPVSAANKINVEIHVSENNIFEGELSDISAEGMCIRFPKKLGLGLDNYTGETQCIIKLPDNLKIQCAFTIHHSCFQDPGSRLHIGGHFERLDKIQRRAIERFVIELQRKNRKKMTR